MIDGLDDRAAPGDERRGYVLLASPMLDIAVSQKHDVRRLSPSIHARAGVGIHS